MDDSDKLIEQLEMNPHPEGGHYKESYRNNNISLIYYILKRGEKSHWHKLKKNEILHFYNGDPLEVFISNDEITIKEITLSKEVKSGHFLHYVIKAGTWFCMESKGEYSLIGCTVAPPFDYKDFELAPKGWYPGKVSKN
jgi:hypothetical protein